MRYEYTVMYENSGIVLLNNLGKWEAINYADSHNVHHLEKVKVVHQKKDGGYEEI